MLLPNHVGNIRTQNFLGKPPRLFFFQCEIRLTQSFQSIGLCKEKVFLLLAITALSYSTADFAQLFDYITSDDVLDMEDAQTE